MAKPLKIGLVLDTSLDPPDGVQQYVVSLGEWLRSRGHDVHYLVGETRRRALPNIHSLTRNVTVRFNGNTTTIPLPAPRHRLRRLLAEEQFDILHVQTPHSPFLAQRLVLATAPKTAVIGTFHIAAYGWLSRVGNRLLGVWLRPSLKRFYKLVSVSDAAADFARRSFKMDSEVIPNAFDYRRFRTARRLAKYDGDRLTILFLNRLVPRKGCLVLLKAIRELAKNPDLPPFRVVICGRGPMESRLRRFIRKNGLRDRVEMAGFVSETAKPRYLASADIAVFPSSGGESFGIVLLEAMASGRAAVLAGDNPGYHTVMKPQPEQLFDPTDVGELAARLSNYLTDDKLRQTAADWGREYTKQFDVAVVGQKIESIYRAALRSQSKT